MTQAWSVLSLSYQLPLRKIFRYFCHWNWPHILRYLPTQNRIKVLACYLHDTRIKAGSFAAVTSKIKIVASVTVSLRHQECSQTSEKRWTILLFLYQKILSRSQAFTPGNKFSKTDEADKLEGRKLPRTQPHDQLDMGCWSCASHHHICMNTLNMSTYCDCIIPYAVLSKALPNQIQSNLGLINKLNLFLRSQSQTIYNIFLGFNASADLSLTDGTNASLERHDSWIIVVQNFNSKNIRPGNIQLKCVMWSVSCSNWLLSRLLVQFVARLATGSIKNFLFQTLSQPSISENLMISLWIQTPLLSSGLHENLSLQSSRNCEFNTLDNILTIFKTAS